MRERMELIGGAIELDSAPGEGTRIRLEAAVQVAAEVVN
jgi:signal transduction histidine kinase